MTKDQLLELKKNNLKKLYSLLKRNEDNKEIIFILKNLGHLPENFDGSILIPLIYSKNKDVRFWAIKNIGKTQDLKYLEILSKIATNDDYSIIRREAVSSIGRMRLPQSKPILIKLLDDKDPKVILQAIRGLLVFKKNISVKNALIKLADHPNETIQSVIRREFFKKESSISIQPHPLSPDFLKNTVVKGDVLEILQYVPAESIHLTFTSPPYYNARDYSIYESYEAYLNFLTDVFCQIQRITKDGRFLIVNTSPVIVPRVSRAHSSKRYPIPFDLHCRIVQNGWEFIDDIVWLKPESSVKNRNAGFFQHRKPLGYKPNPTTEYLMVYRKETDKLLDWNMNQYDRDTVENSRITGEYETSNIWKIDPTFDRVHSAVFPIELCNRVISFYSYIGDLVFDPFAGSGTFGKAAVNLDRYFFLTEIENKYIDRMKVDLEKPFLFQQTETRFLDLDEFASLSKDT